MQESCTLPNGELLSHTGTSDTPFQYNGRDGILIEADGLYYMRARYYSPEIKRFINEDTLKGSVKSSNMLNRYTFAIGNPVSNIDPRGLSSEPGVDAAKIATEIGEKVATAASVVKEFQADNYVWEKRLALLKSSEAFNSFADKLAYLGIGIEVAADIYTDYQSGYPLTRIISDSIIDVVVTGGNIAISTVLGGLIGGAFLGPVGTAIGAVATAGISLFIQHFVIDEKWNGTESDLQLLKNTVYAEIS
jgi:RHS repeat-associated protein